MLYVAQFSSDQHDFCCIMFVILCIMITKCQNKKIETLKNDRFLCIYGIRNLTISKYSNFWIISKYSDYYNFHNRYSPNENQFICWNQNWKIPTGSWNIMCYGLNLNNFNWHAVVENLKICRYHTKKLFIPKISPFKNILTGESRIKKFQVVFEKKWGFWFDN